MLVHVFTFFSFLAVVATLKPCVNKPELVAGMVMGRRKEVPQTGMGVRPS